MAIEEIWMVTTLATSSKILLHITAEITTIKATNEGPITVGITEMVVFDLYMTEAIAAITEETKTNPNRLRFKKRIFLL